MKIGYRSDIDGLRAIAVISVILFHTKYFGFSGGYVGVDIFFVISGYLISSIIYSEIDSNCFSLKNFYERRFKRILPALFVVTVFSFIVGLIILSPSLLEKLGKSIIYLSFLSSNIYFYKESGYFDLDSSLKPLLHTWSLGVEEQFYLIFPFFIYIIYLEYREKLYKILFFLFLSSISASTIITIYDQSFAFYLLPTRIWEFLLGVFISTKGFPSIKKPVILEFISLVGIFLIILSIFTFNEKIDFPGIAALIPSFGTALIIYSSKGNYKTFTSKLLSFKPFVTIGLMSYSLYLWHWPLLVYANIYFIHNVNINIIYKLLAVTLIFSYLSWKYIEIPFRKGSAKIQMKYGTYKMSFSALTLLLVSGMILKHTKGLQNRYNMNLVFNNWHHWKQCEEKFKKTSIPCKIGYSNGVPTFLLWGDSHARALADGIDKISREENITGVITTKSSCPPLLNIDKRYKRRSCSEFNEDVLRYIINHPNIETIILEARWALWWTGKRYGEEKKQIIKLYDTNKPSFEGSNIYFFKKGLTRLLEKLTDLNKTVVLVGPVPEVGFNVPSIAPVVHIRDLNITEYSPTKSKFISRSGDVVDFLRELNRTNDNITLINPSVKLYKNNHLKIIKSGIPIYRDDDHLSYFGSIYISDVFSGKIKHEKSDR